MAKCCVESGRTIDALQYSRQVWSLLRQCGWTKNETERKYLAIAYLGLYFGMTSRFSECFQALKCGLQMAQEAKYNAHLHGEFFILTISMVFCFINKVNKTN